MGIGVQKYGVITNLLTWPIGLPGKIPFPPFARSRETWKKERSSTSNGALHAMGRTGRAIVWFADLLCNGWRGGIFWNK